jgi:hypothetical protein
LSVEAETVPGDAGDEFPEAADGIAAVPPVEGPGCDGRLARRKSHADENDDET